MSKILDLLKDREYTASLLNGACLPGGGPLNPGWIDNDMSDSVTNALLRLLPDGVPYLIRVVVERNPDTLFDGIAVDDPDKRMRYFVVTVIPDTEFPYNQSYPLIHAACIGTLVCWESIRSVLSACTKDFLVRVNSHPTHPILNSAEVKWVSLYVGREPYDGLSKLSEQWEELKLLDRVDIPVNLYKVREMEEKQILSPLIEAYEEDYPPGL